MRTTLDLPDPLFKHLKARAAMEGRSLRDLMVELVEKGLGVRHNMDPQQRLHARPVFGVGPATDALKQGLSAGPLDTLMHEDDDERAQQFMAGR
jgi:hypothetical protein